MRLFSRLYFVLYINCLVGERELSMSYFLVVLFTAFHEHCITSLVIKTTKSSGRYAIQMITLDLR